MKRLALLSVLALAACEETGFKVEQPAQLVHGGVRYWEVIQTGDAPVVYRATRGYTGTTPYQKRAQLLTADAIRAIEKATGCKAIRSTVVQDISGYFYSQVACG